ncbi:MAG TPA: GNAT family N-acetyltransferase [Solirubrobacteraceae bacterium]|nr:GNAT family N-acetyltransferase [Solirubrobacteraceae bacterium]
MTGASHASPGSNISSEVDPRRMTLRDGRVVDVRPLRRTDRQGLAEIAATVTDDWQGHGLGTALLTQLAARAREEGYSAFRASVLASNRRSIAMLLAAGFAPLPSGGGLREYELALRCVGV